MRCMRLERLIHLSCRIVQCLTGFLDSCECFGCQRHSYISLSDLFTSKIESRQAAANCSDGAINTVLKSPIVKKGLTQY
jgi:hypothetical protein